MPHHGELAAVIVRGVVRVSDQDEASIDFEEEDPFLTRCREQLENAFREYDRLILTVSSGILAITAAFYHRSTTPQHGATWLVLCWVFLLAAIFCVAASLLTEQAHLRHLIKVNGKVKDDETDQRLRRATAWLNRGSGGFFFFGTLFLVVYLCLNVKGV